MKKSSNQNSVRNFTLILHFDFYIFNYLQWLANPIKKQSPGRRWW